MIIGTAFIEKNMLTLLTKTQNDTFRHYQNFVLNHLKIVSVQSDVFEI